MPKYNLSILSRRISSTCIQIAVPADTSLPLASGNKFYTPEEIRIDSTQIVPTYKKIYENEIQHIKKKLVAIKDMLANVHHCIINNQPNLLMDQLREEYIYPEILGNELKYETDGLRTISCNYDVHAARPLIEALFFDYPHKLWILIKELKKRDNEKLRLSLLNSMENTDINIEKIFSWNKEIVKSIRDQMTDMQSYAKQLEKQNTEKSKAKSEAIVTIIRRLKIELDAFQKHYQEKDDPTTKDKLELLAFKLKFAKLLHRNDKQFEEHRGYKRCVWNILFALFSLGTAQLANKYFTGNYLFFNQTATQEKVSNLQKTLRLT
jgi:hypothetical protein